MTLPTFVAATSAGDISGTTLDITRPGTASNGRVRIIVIYVELTNPTVTVTGGTGGWTEITACAVNNANGGSVDYAQRVFYHRDDGSDPATYTVAWGGSNVWRGGVCSAYDTVQASGDPTEAGNANESETSATTITGLSITTLGADRKLIFCGDFFYSSATTFGSPSPGGTRRGNISALVFLCDRDFASAGATGNHTIEPSPDEDGTFTSAMVGLIGSGLGGGGGIWGQLLALDLNRLVTA